MVGALIAGIIVAAAGATAGLWGSLKDDADARDKLTEQRNYVSEMYTLNKARAEEEFQAAKNKADREAKNAETQADLTDKSLDISEQGLSQDFNTTIDNLYLSQASDAMSWNLASMQAGSAEGAAYSNLAASGVRAGSSLSDAILMESAVNENQLQFSQDTKRRTDNNNLASVLSNLAGNRVNIQSNRIGADITRDEASYLRNSYLKGGYNYNLYQNQLASLEKQTGYQLSQIDKEYELHSGWNSFANAFISFNTMGAKGFGTGYSIGNSVNQSVSYK